MEHSENTVGCRLKSIPEQLFIENRQKGRKYYLLDLEQMHAALKEIYNQGIASVETTYVHPDDLRNAIGKINGIGEKAP